MLARNSLVLDSNLELQDDDDLMAEISALQKTKDSYNEIVNKLKAKTDLMSSILKAETSVELEEIVHDLPPDLKILPKGKIKAYVDLAHKKDMTTAYEFMGISSRTLPNGNVKIQYIPDKNDLEDAIIYLTKNNKRFRISTYVLPRNIPVIELAGEFLPKKGKQDMKSFIYSVQEYVLSYWARKSEFHLLQMNDSALCDISPYCNGDCTNIVFSIALGEKDQYSEFNLRYDLKGYLPDTVQVKHPENLETTALEELRSSAEEVALALKHQSISKVIERLPPLHDMDNFDSNEVEENDDDDTEEFSVLF